MRRRLHRDIRLLKGYAIATTLVLLWVIATGFRQEPPARSRFEEINVERINIVEKDGRVRLVLANSERQAAAVIDGKTLLPNRRRPAGMMFFNEEGDEVGGLIFTGSRGANGVAQASGSLTFDQYKQDQTVALQYSEGSGGRRAGLSVIDRPQTSLALLADLVERREKATGDQRAALDRELAAQAALSPTRMFVGKDLEGRSMLALSDAQGKQRLLLSVDRAGAPKIQFLDEAGKVVREIVP
jgi:hypothetical protein